MHSLMIYEMMPANAAFTSENNDPYNITTYNIPESNFLEDASLSLKIVKSRWDVANYFKNKKWHKLCSDKCFCFKILQNVNYK